MATVAKRFARGFLAISLTGSMFHSAYAASPKVEDALKLVPVQKEVDYDDPKDVSKCTIKPEKIDGQTGWVVRDADGRILRRFADTNADNVVDQWSYYLEGAEVYRDIDANFNGKADQYRWLTVGGARWGEDANEDGRIDAWKMISAEEVSAEVVHALATRDADRFARLLITPEELRAAGIGGEKAAELTEKVNAAPAAFRTMAARQKSIDKDTQWLNFGGSRPGIVPKGSDSSTKDILVYESSVAMYETGNQHGQVQLGTLIRVGDTWRMIDIPTLSGEDVASASPSFFYAARRNEQPEVEGAAENAKAQALLAELQKVDENANQAGTPAELKKIQVRRADILEELSQVAGSEEDRQNWIRQLADSLSAAAQSGAYPEGVDRLADLQKKLAEVGNDEVLAAHVKFRHMTAEYNLAFQAPNPNFAQIQTDWLKQLSEFVNNYPDSADAAEAMLHLGITEELSGQEAPAKEWYEKIVTKFPSSQPAKKAAGAIRRLDSVGKPMQLRAPTVPGGKAMDLAQHYRNKVVLIQYWAAWCEPAKADMETLKTLQAKYGKRGFAVVGVSLDGDASELNAYLSKERLPWVNVYEPGGLDSRLANEMGILTLPTMMLIDQDGRVVNRSIHAGEIDAALGALLK